MTHRVAPHLKARWRHLLLPASGDGLRQTGRDTRNNEMPILPLPDASRVH